MFMEHDESDKEHGLAGGRDGVSGIRKERASEDRCEADASWGGGALSSTDILATPTGEAACSTHSRSVFRGSEDDN